MFDANPYFADTLEKSLIVFLSELPLSGNIMNIPSGSKNERPTSSPTETDFDVLKNDLFHSSTGIRVDSFIKRHLVFTKGRLIGKHAKEVRDELFESDDQSKDQDFKNEELRKSKIDDNLVENPCSSKSLLEQAKSPCSSNSLLEQAETSFEDLSLVDSSDFVDQGHSTDDSLSSIDNFDDKFNKYENCNGVNEDGPMKDRKMHRCQTSILNPQRGINQRVPCLQNGHTSTRGNPVKTSWHTCAFDALFQFYAVAYSDNPTFKSMIDKSLEPNSVCELTRLLFTERECNILNRRNNLLHKLYNDKVKIITPKQLEIDCFSTVNHTFQKISQDEIELQKTRQLHTCKHCGAEDIKYYQYVLVHTCRQGRSQPRNFRGADQNLRVPSNFYSNKKYPFFKFRF